MKTSDAIIEECSRLRNLLLAKNREYGDSALNPIKVFSSLGVVDRIKVRIDDKLARIAETGPKLIKEDTILDLLGYLIFLRITDKQKNEDNTKHEEPVKITGMPAPYSPDIQSPYPPEVQEEEHVRGPF